MNQEQDKFDDIFRSKFSEQEFPFSEENWDKAEAMLDSKRKKRNFWRIAAIFLIGLSAGIALMLPFVNTDKKKGNDKIVVQVVPKQKQKEEVQVVTKKVLEEKNIPEEKLLSAETEKVSVPKEEQTLSLKEEEKNTVPMIVREMPVKENIEGTKEPVKVEKEPIAVLSNDNIQEKVIVKKNDQEVKQEVVKQEVAEQKKTVKTQIDTTPAVQSQETQDPVVLVGMNVKSDSSSDKKINALQNKIDSLSQVIALAFAKDNLSPKKDSSVVIPPAVPESTSTPAPAQSEVKANIFSIDAGTTYTFGWHYSDTTEARGFNPVVGFGFTHLFDTHWSVQTGIQYGSVAHLAASTKTYTTATLDFGMNGSDSTIETRWIHYAVVPLFLNYHFNNKNSIGIGGSVSYLVNTTSDLVTSTYSDFKDPEQTTKRSYGYTQGFKPWNASLALAYRRKITDKFSVSAEVHYGLMDIKDNAFFSKQKTERNSGVKLIVRYDIF
jgi:hypothetical protein